MGWLGNKVTDRIWEAVNDCPTGKRTPMGKVLDGVIKGTADNIVRGLEPLEKVEDTLDKVELLFTDVEVEGKKRGYERAAAEYEVIFTQIEKMYKETQQFLRMRITENNRVADELIEKLQILEEEKEKLKNEVEKETSYVASTFNIPRNTVKQAVSSGTLLDINSSLGILDFIIYKKEKKLHEAEAKGYREAKIMFNEKVKKLQDNYRILKKEGEREIQNLLELIHNILDDIVQEEIKIAELKIALKS